MHVFPIIKGEIHIKVTNEAFVKISFISTCLDSIQVITRYQL